MRLHRADPGEMLALMLLAILACTGHALADKAMSMTHQQARRSLKMTNPSHSSSGELRLDIDASDAFWVFGSEGVTIINTKGTLLHRIHKDSICQRYESCPRGVVSGGPGCTWTNNCNWGRTATDGQEYVMATLPRTDQLMVFDIKTGMLVTAIKTCGFPWNIDLAGWRDEAYVHCWYPDSDDEGTVDIFSTNAWAINHPQVMATFNPKTQGHGNVFVDIAVPNFVYSTNLADPGLHKFNIDTREELKFLNLSSRGCNSAGTLVISARSMHGYLQCYRPDFSSFLVEIDLVTDQVVHTHLDVSGTPVMSPDGSLLAVLNNRANRVHLLAIGNAAQQADDVAVQDLTMPFKQGGMSMMTWVGHATGKHSRLALVSSTLDNFVVVVDMDTLATTNVPLPEPKDGNTSSLAEHGASREIFAAQGADGKLHTMVAASRMGWLHLVDVASTGKSGAVVATLEDLDVKRIVYVPRVAGASAALTNMLAEAQSASAASDKTESIAVAALVIACVGCAAALISMALRWRDSASGAQLPCAGTAPVGYQTYSEKGPGGLGTELTGNKM